jgi:hypothetical protein
MSRHRHGCSPMPWSKLKSRVEALFAPNLALAIHCNIFVKVTRHFTFDKPATRSCWATAGMAKLFGISPVPS